MNRNVHVPFLGEERTATFISLPDPRTSAKDQRIVRGFQTGDIVRAIVPRGVKAGVYVGRVAVRATGSFNIQTKSQLIQGMSYRYCRPLHKADGYSYQKGEGLLLPMR